MLTADQSIVVFDRGRAFPDRLTRSAHRRYVAHAEQMLAAYQGGIGQTRGELHRRVEAILADEPDCPARRIAAFCKLLDDASAFASDPRAAAELRLDVFSRAATRHPLVSERSRLFDATEAEVKEEIARELGRPWEEIDHALYADVMDQHLLERFDGYPGAPELLSRYNVAQTQACLYRAEGAVIHARADFKTILRHAKLARLLHQITRLGLSHYRIDLDGPASVLMETRRYGVRFARYLTALLACRDWQMTARVRAPWGQPARLELSAQDGLKSPVAPPEEFDSSVEERFARKFGEERDGWRLSRESEILHAGQSAFIPDFVFTHADGSQVLLEIVGFWTPEYLAKKRETLRRFAGHRILVAVSAKNVRDGAVIPDGFITYKTGLKLAPVLAALERERERGTEG